MILVLLYLGSALLFLVCMTARVLTDLRAIRADMRVLVQKRSREDA